MPDDLLAPEDEGFFAWLSRPRRAVLNTLRGEYGMAMDQALDFALNIPDALLPGDAIPEFSGPESDIEVGDLANMEPGWKKTAVDIAGGIVADPLTYVPGGRIVQSIAKPVGKAITSTKIGKGLRDLTADSMNWHTLTPQQRALEQEAKAAGNIAASSSEAEARRLLAGLTPDEGRDIFDAVQNVTIDAAGVPKYLGAGPRVPGVQDLSTNQLTVVNALSATPAWAKADPARRALLEQRAKDVVALGQTQADEFLAGKIDPAMIGKADGAYLMREFGDDTAMASAGRSYKTDQELLAALQADPALLQGYKRDLHGSLMRRAQQQGTIATRETIGEQILGRPVDMTSMSDRKEVAKILRERMNNPDERDAAKRALTLFEGMGKRNAVESALAAFNRNLFKPAATVGVIVPRVSFSVRNSISSIVQALSTPGARGAAVKDPKWIYDRLVGGIMDPIDEAYKLGAGKHLINDDTNRLLSLTEEAFAASGGSVAKAKQYLKGHADPLAKEALGAMEQNVLMNPVKLDEVMAELRPDASWLAKAKNNVYDLPAKLNKHVEDRMRAGLWLAARRKAGQTPEAAAASIRNSVLDYEVPTVENRTMRTYIPFGAFMSQTLPQSGKLLTENLIEGGIPGAIAGGAARGAATQMFEADPDNPIYPDMVGKMTVPWGQDEKGNPQYLTSLGLPIEGLGDIPEGFSGREFERFGGVAAHPLIKAGYSFVSGRDPFFGTPYGSYDKPTGVMELLGMESGPTAATARKLLGTGAAQPLTHLMNLPEPYLDERQGLGLDLVKSLTGARVRSVDEDQALRLQMEEALRENPRIRQYTTFSKTSDDPETVDLVEKYNDLRQRIRKNKAEAAKVQ